MAIMPTNSASEASAAASSTTARTMESSREQRANIVPFLFSKSSGACSKILRRPIGMVNRTLTNLRTPPSPRNKGLKPRPIGLSPLLSTSAGSPGRSRHSVSGIAPTPEPSLGSVAGNPSLGLGFGLEAGDFLDVAARPDGPHVPHVPYLHGLGIDSDALARFRHARQYAPCPSHWLPQSRPCHIQTDPRNSLPGGPPDGCRNSSR
jgi:hypothetical protein